MCLTCVFCKYTNPDGNITWSKRQYQ